MVVRTPIPRRRGSRARLAALAAALALVIAGPVAAASAAAPVTLGSGYVLDEADVLTPAEESEAQERLEQLRADSGLDLWVVYVDAFTSPESAIDWTDEVAIDNGLGPTQYLLGIAVDTRQMNLSGDLSGPLTDAQIGTITQERILPALQADEWLGAVHAAAAGLTTAEAGGTGGADENLGATPGFSGAWIGLLVGGVLVVGIVVLVVVLVRRRRRNGADAPAAPAVPTAELARQASSALIDADDGLRTSEQELGFATAQFGDAATVEFAAVLASAREKVAQAFALKQQLDDAAPDTEEQVRAWNTDIIRLCAEADEAIDAKAAEFDELRTLEADAPAAIERVRVARESAAAEVDGAAGQLQTLRSTYAGAALATVEDNAEQARARIAFADTRLADAATALADGRTGEAAVAIRDAEEAAAQAVQLEQAVDALGADLTAAESRAREVIAGLEADMRAAATLPDPDGRIAATTAATRARVDAAAAGLDAPGRSPREILQTLQAADREIDDVVQAARDAAERGVRIGRQLDTQIAQAQAQLSAAENFVSSRRGAIGADARTRLAESSAALSRAQAQRLTAPDAALSDARRADELAAQAIGLARTDVGGFAVPQSGGGGDGFFGGMLGGLLSDSLLGGGSAGSSWSSGSSRSSRSSWSSGSSRRSGGFGGGSRSRSGSRGFGGGSRGRSGGSRSSRGGGRF